MLWTIWSVSEAVVSDTGVVEALVFSISAASSSTIAMFAEGGVGISSLELVVPILWFDSNVDVETRCLNARIGVSDGGG